MIKNEIHRVLKSRFARNVATVSTGNTFAQIVPFLVAPILTRLYPPDAFGLFALFASTVSFIQGMSTLKYEAAIQMPKGKDEAITLMGISFSLLILVSLITYVFFTLFASEISSILKNTYIRKWLAFAPLLIFANSTSSILNVWTSRIQKFSRVAAYAIIAAVITGASKIIFGMAGNIDGGLILGAVVGSSIARFLYILDVFSRDGLRFRDLFAGEFIYTASCYKEFPIYLNSQQLTGRVKQTGLIYMISIFFGSTILGWYSLAFSVLYKPIVNIGQAVARVYYQKIVETLHKKGNIWDLTIAVVGRLSVVGALMFLPVLLWGQKIFTIAFGPDWSNAGKYAQILSPWLFLVFVEQGMSKLAIALNKQKLSFRINLIQNTVILLVAYMAIEHLGLNFIVILLIITTLEAISVSLKMFFYRFWALEYSSNLE